MIIKETLPVAGKVTRLPNFGCVLSYALVHSNGSAPFDAWEAGPMTPGEIHSLRYLGRDEVADPEVPHDVWEANVSDGVTYEAKLFLAQPCEDSILGVPDGVEEACGADELADTIAHVTGLSERIAHDIVSVWNGLGTGSVGLRAALWQTELRPGLPVCRFVILDGKGVGMKLNGPEGSFEVSRAAGLFIFARVEVAFDAVAAVEAAEEIEAAARAI